MVFFCHTLALHATTFFSRFLRVSKMLVNIQKKLINFSNTLVNYFSLLFLCLFFFSNFVSNIDQGGTKMNKSNTSLIIIFYKIRFLRVCKMLVNTWKMLVNSSKMLVNFSNMLVNYFSLLFLCLFLFSNFVSNIDKGTPKRINLTHH